MSNRETQWNRQTRYPLRITNPDDAAGIKSDFDSYANTILEIDAEATPEDVRPTIEKAAAAELPAILHIDNFDTLDRETATNAARDLKALSERVTDDILILLTNVESLSTYEPDLRGRVKNTT